jgi:hypothetical protein
VVRRQGLVSKLSSCGFRQCNPLSPLLFSLSIRQTLEDLQRTLEGHGDFLLLSYLDDIAILSNGPNTISIVSDFLHASSSPLRLNRSKSTTTSFDKIRNSGIEILGMAVGSTESRQHFLQKKIEEQEKIWSLTQLRFSADLGLHNDSSLFRRS